MPIMQDRNKSNDSDPPKIEMIQHEIIIYNLLD